MKRSLLKLTAVACGLAPALVRAHPGHLDDAPLAHQLSHGVFYLLAVLAVAVLVKQHGERVRRFLTARKRRHR